MLKFIQGSEDPFVNKTTITEKPKFISMAYPSRKLSTIIMKQLFTGRGRSNDFLEI